MHLFPDFLRKRSLGVLAVTAGLAFPCLCPAIDLIENFDGTALNETVWQPSGDLPRAVNLGRLTWGAGGGNWASGDISSVQRFFMPPDGQTTVIEWTLAPGTVTNNTGSSIRMQMGIHSGNQTVLQREHWRNTKGGVWLDLDNINPASPGTAGGAYRSANDTKADNSEAAHVAGANSNWTWGTDNRVYRLEITNMGYKWFDKTASAEVPTAEQEWAAAGIDTEFDNGFRVLALGMNFDAGRGTTAVDRIAITNAFGPSSLITNFSATRANPFSGQPTNLTWIVDPAATVSVDQGIGNVTPQTVAGIGTFQIIPPDVTDPTPVTYTLTAVKGAATSTREFVLNVQPPPLLSLDDFADHFDDASLNTAEWEHRGDKTYIISDSKINWAANGGNWGHGEVDTVKVFPVPPAGRLTTIRWTLGKADVTLAGPGGSSLRPVLGICSAFETNGWTRQHWQNTTGGVWLDVTSMGDNRLTGVTGTLHTSNDTKAENTNATQIGTFNVSDWNWETDPHVITLELTSTGFTWFNGPQALGSGTWAAAGIDTEFSKGFRVMAVGANWDTGRGEQSYDAVSLTNAAPIPFEIDRLVFDPQTDLATVTFKSTIGVNYALDTATNLGPWTMVDQVLATTTNTSLNHTAATGTKAYYRIRNKDLRPLP